MGELIFIIGLAVAALVLLVARKPDTFRVERSLVIAAPAAKIFPMINDLHAWETWSPWAKKDPASKAAYSGARDGVGAAFAWDGNRQVGKGRMEITASEPVRRIAMRLNFEKPFVGENHTEFTLEPEGAATRVRWVMTGASPFAAKVMGLFFDMDTAIGKDFEAGLASIKAIAEKS
jgi:uncharacterized protein YndB with AHSA1/START domain